MYGTRRYYIYKIVEVAHGIDRWVSGICNLKRQSINFVEGKTRPYKS